MDTLQSLSWKEYFTELLAPTVRVNQTSYIFPVLEIYNTMKK